ncbi:hypothetical protein AC249_AIPGENE13439 [Exaiptasia diaphana]|nr:hypothetical protein AC249_AIPGENE13439 [Exaiptasia diaphana]
MSNLTSYQKTLLITLGLSFVLFLPVCFHYVAPEKTNVFQMYMGNTPQQTMPHFLNEIRNSSEQTFIEILLPPETVLYNVTYIVTVLNMKSSLKEREFQIEDGNATSTLAVEMYVERNSSTERISIVNKCPVNESELTDIPSTGFCPAVERMDMLEMCPVNGGVHFSEDKQAVLSAPAKMVYADNTTCPVTVMTSKCPVDIVSISDSSLWSPVALSLGLTVTVGVPGIAMFTAHRLFQTDYEMES